jgi:hypothetical protein
MSNPYQYNTDAAAYGGTSYAFEDGRNDDDDDPYRSSYYDDDDDDDDAAAGASAGAGGVLALGSSVSVNADLHRGVRQEIAELDELCRRAKSGLDSEARTSRELGAGHRHADAEMKELAALSARTLDSVDVGERILRELRGTILESFHASNSDSKQKQQQHDGGGHGHGHGHGHKTPMDHLAHVSAESWAAQKAHQERVAERRSEQRVLKGKALKLVGLMKVMRAVLEASEDRTPELDRQIAELRARQEQAEQVLAEEEQRLRSLEAATKDTEAGLVVAQEVKANKVRFKPH